MSNKPEQTCFNEGFRLTRWAGGIKIETTDYHSRPLFLDRLRLAKLGLALVEDVATSGLEVEKPQSHSPRPSERKPEAD
ncbi:MAG: hypothetical protein IFK94_10375 [Acidobacteria bacterium]|uniref:Uncharacterized protein n=1 Tax=Candidatus Polarisedimenticola svalbardensis TaxID=2886004 RepID=A0A8J6Y906_9BACT|nr:hypothetical protein [Candidatus Polarisedimenticola svalbardensis]